MPMSTTQPRTLDPHAPAPQALDADAPDADVRPDPNPWVARSFALGAALVIVLFFGLLVWGLGRRAAGTVGVAPIQTRPAPAFSVPLFEGGTVSLAEQRGTPVL